MRTIDWSGDAITIIDQTALPGELRVLRIDTVDALVDAIRRLAVRGAPALGAAGALGVALAAVGGEGGDEGVRSAAAAIRAARPTAVNLAWGVDRALGRLEAGAAAVVSEALAVLDEDAATNRAIGKRGAELLTSMGLRDVTVLTHCNTGALACVEWGTALGIVRQLHGEGRLKGVVADETRPLLQGARLTAFELAEMGVDYRVIVDSAAASVLGSGRVDVAIVGADRITANGDVVNKIGTLQVALAAAHFGVPFLVAAPESTIDPTTERGSDVTVEDRAPEEVTSFAGVQTTPAGSDAINPAFDVTPAGLVTAVVTEQRVIEGRAAESAVPTG
jgi:methylthioribose-1-phosphate isomerase